MISRFVLRTIIASLMTLTVIVGTLSAAEKNSAERPPNIIYMLCDDLGYGDLSCYGQKRFQTPNIDRLAAEGMRFTQHYSGSTVCAPSRSSLMTGLHTGHTPIRGNKEYQPVGQHPLPADSVTVAEHLKKAGYATGCFGKWGMGYPESEGEPLEQGFDTFYGYNCQRNAHTYYPRWLFHDRTKIELDGRTYAHDLISAKALEFIRAHKDRPFFCYLPVTIPHAAMQVPEKYHNPFREQFPQFEDKIGKYSHGTSVKNPIAGFAGMIAKLDEDVGRLQALLKELDLDEDTLVIFTSDNGPHKEGGHDPEFFDSNGMLRGFKRDVYEGGIRVPMIARWPGRIRPNSESDHISAFWDFLPTACELAGIQPPNAIDGLSYAPALLGQQNKQRQHDYLYWEFYEKGGRRAVRFGRWKGVQLDVKQDPPGPIELYDIDVDPSETTNVADKHPKLVSKVRDLFEQAHQPSPVFTW